MKHPLRLLATLAALTLPAMLALGQVPTLISYQARVQVSSTNFTGNGLFKFALVQGSSPTLLWKNDGSGNNTEPANAVTLPVANGLVMTTLGDTTLANMTALPPGAFANPDVRLRVWFNGGLGFQQLVPDQRIVSAGYAFMAHTVPDGSVTLAKLAPGTLNATNLSANTLTSAQLADEISLGATNLGGRLDVYRTLAGTPGVSILGESSQLITYGSDGLEQIRLWGSSWGELQLRDNTTNNAVAAKLSAHESNGGLAVPGGALSLSLGATNKVYLKAGTSGGLLSLYQNDGQLGLVLDGDNGGAGHISVRGTDSLNRASLDGSDGGGGALRLLESDGTETATLQAQGNGRLTLKQGDGSVGLSLTASNGTGGAGLNLYSDTGSYAGQLTVGDGTNRDGFLGLASGAGGGNRFYARVWNGTTASAYLGMLNSAGVQTITLDADGAGDGRITTQVLTITGGSDLSENFEINAPPDELRPGMVVSIDPQNAGELVLAREAYDARVAGIVSGAGGVKTGMLMSQAGTKADGRHPVALTGRVYCYVDAGFGAIQPGDMLTTSTTSGHAMKAVDRQRAHGSIVGKAMTSLPSGRGLVLVLVNLQ